MDVGINTPITPSIQDRQVLMNATGFDHKPSFVQNPDAQQFLQLILWQAFTGGYGTGQY